MDDGKQNKNLEGRVLRQPLSNISNVGSFFQSIWIRCRSIFPIISDRKFMEGELRVVLYCGVIFWIIYIFSKVV